MIINRWNDLPSTKQSLRKAMDKQFIQYFFTPYHKVMDLPTWMKIDQNGLLPFYPDFSSYYEP